jgi:hypothetical protein
MTTLDNQKIIDAMRGHFHTSKSAAYAFGRAVSAIQLLPGLRGFWPMSAVSEAGAAFDLSGNGRTLTYNGNPLYDQHGACPYIDLDGTGDYLSRADEAGLDLLGTDTHMAAVLRGVTMGCWVYLDSLAGDASLIAKWNTTGNQRSYNLEFDSATAAFQYQISADGTAETTKTGGTTAVTGRWYFAAGRFDPSSTLDVWTNGAKVSSATVVGSVFNSTSALNIGARNAGGASLLNGRIALPWLCAAALPDALVGMVYHTTRGLFGVD